MKAEHPTTTGKFVYFVDKCLPFGASISCTLFQKISDALKWITEYKIRQKKRLMNYLDDFLFMAACRQVCNYYIGQFLEICKLINCPIADDKTEWASTQVVFLGVLLDGRFAILIIPEEKRLKAENAVQCVVGKRKVTIKQIQCLTGLLNFLNKCIVPGRVFTRRMYAKLKITKSRGEKLKHYHHVSVDREFKYNLQVWLSFLINANNRNLCHPFADWSNCFVTSQQLDFWTDASKGVAKGFGCVFGNWFAWGQWEDGYIKQFDPSIEYLELFALCVGVFTWRDLDLLKNKRIVIFCDNQAVVEMVNKTTSSCKNCMILLRKLVLLNIQDNRRIFVRYICSAENLRSDALSRLKFDTYFRISPGSLKFPDPLPEELWPASKLWVKLTK